MRSNKFKTSLIKAGLAASVLLLAAGEAAAQSTVNLTAMPQGALMPDGTVVPMWGLSCGASSALNATATATLSTTVTGTVGSITVATGGGGYTSAPTVTISGGGGTGATATVTLGGIGVISATTPGTGYVVGETFTFTGGGGTGATATVASVSATGGILTITVTNQGSGYTTAPTAVYGGLAGTGAALTASLGGVTAITVATPGSGYTAAPTVTIAGSNAAAAAPVAASCTPLNPLAGAAWSPPVIVVPTGNSLAINLTNNLSFQPPTPSTGGAAPPANLIPTSLTIVGQLGGGLGTPTSVASTSHGTQSMITWSTQTGASFTPPTQGARVRSFGTEVAATAGSNSATLTWSNLLPGTYLIESGTHPSIQGPMGLYGILVVTAAPSTSGTTTTAGTAYGTPGTSTAVTYNAEVPLLLSEIDPVQNNSVSAAVNTANFSETLVWSGEVGGCGNAFTASGTPNPAFNTCYPPAVNYLPVYYMINGVAFNRTNPVASLFPMTQGTATGTIAGNVLVRLVNAGLRMHVPSIVGSQTTGFSGAGVAGTTVNGFTLIAEDGNPVPGAPRVQSEVFMAAGKTFDVMINVPAAPLAVYDRELSLSGNQIDRDAGMLAYIGANGAALPSTGAFATAAITAVANPDVYNSVVPGQTLTISDPSKGVIANDLNVYGVKLVGGTATTVGGAAATTLVTGGGTVTLMANGTFSYTPNAAAGGTFAGDSFSYCANGSAAICTTVSLGASTISGGPTVLNSAYTANTASYLAIKPPGVLTGATDPNNLPLSVVTTSVAGAGIVMDASGGFTATLATPCTAVAGCTTTFTFQAQNSHGLLSGTATVTVTFPAASGLVVNVLDGATRASLPVGTNGVPDFRWIIEEDRTFFIDPKCAQNPPPAGCPTAGSGIVPTLGVNFHTSYMPYVAQGCTGPLSCEGGQTIYDPTSHTHINAVCDLGNGVCRPDTSSGTAGGGSGFAPNLPGNVPLDPSKRYYISILPGDAAVPFATGYQGSPNCSTTSASPASGQSYANCGHGMGGAPIPALVSCTATGTGATATTTCTGTTATGTVATCTPAAGATSCLPTGVTLAPVNVLVQPSPYPTAMLSVFVFEDDAPLNGEHDSTGGAGGVNTNLEPGLGQFQIHLWDAMGGNGDFTGQMTYDMFNQPLTNSLDGTIDPLSGMNACPITQAGINNPGTNATFGPGGAGMTASNPSTTAGITGMIVTCPEYEADGVTPSPLAGQAVVSNLMPGRWGVIATPGADRISRGEEWLQTNTLDGQKAHDSFTRIGEPSYFQEYGPASFHVSIGFANPAIINARKPAVCAGTDPTGLGPYLCNNTLTGRVTSQRLSRTPDERLYSSGSHDAYAWTQCFVSVGDPDGEDFAFTKCAADGSFTLTGLPDGDWRITTFDQWNDQLVDGLSTPVRLNAGASAKTTNFGDIAATQWETNLYTKTFVDDNKDGVAQASETGIPFANVAVRLRDGSLENLLVTDFTGAANFNETFPLFSWYVVETDVTRYKNTGTHAVYDVGGPADGTTQCGNTGAGNAYPYCGNSAIAKYLANTAETISVPTELRVPGSIYCAGADCGGKSMNPAATGGAASNSSDPPSVCTTTAATATSPATTSCSTTLSSGRIDNPAMGAVEGWQGFPGQSSFVEFGKTPYLPGENGGIKGHVIYASTRPFDDPMMLVQTQWTPLVPHVTINLYQEGYAADGVTPTLTLVDTTRTSSWDDWAQGWRVDANGNVIADANGGIIPNMSCPGQAASTGVTPDLFFFSLYNQPQYLDLYNNLLHGTAGTTALPYNSQFKCYDGMHNWNQLQPAPYDGMYKFPSVVAKAGATNALPAVGTNYLLQYDPAPITIPGTTVPTFSYKTNCTICTPNHVVPTTDPSYGTPMLPPGKYVVEVVLPQGYELVKEEDKNILIGDNFIAPVTQQFGGLGNVFIMPDQAQVATAYTYAGIGFNANSNCAASFPGTIPGNGCANGVNLTTSLGAAPENGIVPGFIPEPIWPCVGEARIVPDYISLYPWTKQVAPFAGATRRLCDRKEVTLTDQSHSIAKFYVYTSTHIASKFTGGITDDYTSEFDPFSPQFGEKFAPPDLPVSVKDWSGAETNRVYADHWGAYNGMTYSTWEVNPPNPTGYSPTMMIFCMNDPGPIVDSRAQILSPTGTLVSNPTFGQTITDPLYTPGYSQFCYELPFMPGTTQYLDTPVVPTSAFAGAGYNNVDCAYPDATPAVKEVDGDAIGPWVANAGSALTIYALGDQMVPNNAYDGPSATVAPYNQKKIRRHYGFGTTTGSVTIGGVAATVGSWSDTKIVVTVPAGVPACAIQQQAIYAPGATPALCGELMINTAAVTSGGQVTGVTVTRGGSYTTTPTVTFIGGGGTGATGTVNLGGGGVTAVAVSNGGAGYSSAPTVGFTGGGGAGASATATMRKRVSALTIVSGGTYSCTGAAPTVTFSAAGGGGTRATGTVQLTACAAGATTRSVTGVTITNPTTNNYGLGATVTATFSGPVATRATGSVVTGEYVSAVAVTAGGTGYTTAPGVTFTGGGTPSTNATATATLGGATVASVTITNGGTGYTTAPTVLFSAGTGGGGSRALGTATINPLATSAGRRSVDAVTVTIGGKAPTHVSATQTIQSAIDAAYPGDLIIVDPNCNATATGAAAACSSAALAAATPTQVASQAAHNEMLIMWKPVRLQGVAAASSVIDGTTHPAGDLKLSAWRAQVDCLFGLALNGQPPGPKNSYDSTGKYTCPGSGWNFFSATAINPQVDRLPLEAVLGWDTNLNGNLAELLQEPSLMGALEGAGITVLGKGVNFPSNPYDPTLLAGFPTGTTLLQNTVSAPNGATCLDTTGAVNPFPSNFSCNPSSIDALTITQSSQGGGGIFLHGWNHNIQIANNRIYSNAGTLAGGINVGQGEFAPPYIQGSGTNAAPGSCEESPVAGIVLPYCQNVGVNMHNNYISLNSSTGDELFSATPAGPGGVSICTGADYYKFNYNWVCGNLSSGDGGGVGHLGFSSNGDIEHNSILFNQSTNPTIPANGGGLLVMGAPDVDVTCPLGNGTANVLDLDCAFGTQANILANAYGPSDGTGPGLVINANLIMGNMAESGTGGGIAFNAVNGSDMVAFPDDPGQWNSVTLTNNVIVDNVAGWDGAGISLLDSPNVNIVNNTIALNDSTATAGVLFNTLGAPLASQGGPTCTVNCGTSSLPQVAGVVALQHSALLSANLSATPVVCPPGHYQGTGAAAATNGACRTVSYPKLENNIIYNNASYQVGVGSLSAQFQQNVITLYNAVFTGAAPTVVVPSQTTTGQCFAASYWDIGIRGDTGPTNHASGFTLNPTDSVLSSGGYTGGGNSAGNPNFISSYCNGSRQPPEACTSASGCGWAVPPGISDATVPNPIFNLTPAATVDEGNNWVNITYGPLTMSNATVIAGANGNYGGGLALGNYAINFGSAAAGLVTGANFTDAPEYDFFDNPRKTGDSTTAGAIRLAGTPDHSQFTLSAAVIDFGSVPHGSATTIDQDVIVTNADVVPLTVSAVGFSCAGLTGCNAASFAIQPQADNCTGVALGAGQSCTITVVFNPSPSQGVRSANLVVTAGGLSQTVLLTGVDSLAVASASAITPVLNPTPASTVAITGTVTVTNAAVLCLPSTAAACPAGSSAFAGPYIPTAITLTPAAVAAGVTAGTWALGGTCAVGTAINPGVAPVPAGPGGVPPATAAVPDGTCTVTVTYTPPVGVTPPTTQTATLYMTGVGNAAATPIINNVVITAN